MYILGVVGPITGKADYLFVAGDLTEQVSGHGRVAHFIGGHCNGPNLQRLGIDTKVHLAPLAAALCAVLLGLPLTFAQELDASGVSQHVQTLGACLVVHLHLQALLPAAHRAVVGSAPRQARHT